MGVPQLSSILDWDVPLCINHPAIGDPPIYGNPHMDY